ncbi:hypothetical protein EG68_03982 [Paragonimus skrjabini miyazakii]|uniref:Phosphatidylinositol-3-phosphatase SAC1 n=1 Tax=Paragonimus skrjabini miyazakii TaxID=59628 RepID=A0A8S9YZ19_9TREM|nr:hypothetical protein EG68_03982 [Paragonimus skrjabini miyazakii]
MTLYDYYSTMVHEEFRLFTSPEAYYIFPLGCKEVLVIDRVSQTIRIEYDISVIPPTLDSLVIYGIWGTIRLLSGNHLVVITARERVGELFGNVIWKITKSAIFPFVKSNINLSDVQVQDERVYCQMLETVLDMDGFYYSTTFDITHTQQRLSDTPPEFKKKSLSERCDARFTWNRFLLSNWSEQLSAASTGSTATRPFDDSLSRITAWDRFAYCLPIIQGYVGIIPNPQSAHDLDDKAVYALISRRNVNRTGTRFNSRGLNQFGHCSNTIETEQLLELAKHRFSFVQLRGSVPVYWSQKPNLRYKPAVLLGGSQLAHFSVAFETGAKIDEDSLQAAQSAVARQHFNQLIYTYGYGRQVIINLLNQKGMERPLGRAYATATVDLDENEVKYESFDFHQECGSRSWGRLSILLERLYPELQRSRQFHLALDDSRVITRQTGTFRSNCIDCLDRTNVIQSMLSWCALEQALITIGRLSEASASLSASASRSSALADMWPGFGSKFRSLWAENADYCSLQYAGTRALKTDFTRTGKRTFRGMLMDGYYSLIRYYMNNFTDGFRQDAMHLFLGEYAVHDADGTPKPLTGPGGRGRRGSGNADTEWRTQFLPLVFGFAMAMSVLCVAVPTAHWTEQVTYVLFWGAASVLSAFAIFAYGEEFVDRPRFCPD